MSISKIRNGLAPIGFKERISFMFVMTVVCGGLACLSSSYMLKNFDARLMPVVFYVSNSTFFLVWLVAMLYGILAPKK